MRFQEMVHSRGVGDITNPGATPAPPPVPEALQASINSGMNDATVYAGCIPPGAGIVAEIGQQYCDTGSSIPSGSDLVAPMLTVNGTPAATTVTVGTSSSNLLFYAALAVGAYFLFKGGHH
jgi:hypothetical protein